MTAGDTVTELRRQVIAGCGGGAMLYTNATHLVDEYTAAVRMAERRRIELELAKTTGVQTGSEYPLRERLESAAEWLDRSRSTAGVLSSSAGSKVLRWVTGYLAAPGFAADSATVPEAGGAERAVCPEHHQTDCSPLLNGCSRLTAPDRAAVTDDDG